MSNYGTMKVFMLYVNSNGQTQCKTLETRHYISLEEAKGHVKEVREHNEIVIHAVWQPQSIDL
jgi:hypothetical protein